MSGRCAAQPRKPLCPSSAKSYDVVAVTAAVKWWLAKQNCPLPARNAREVSEQPRLSVRACGLHRLCASAARISSMALLAVISSLTTRAAAANLTEVSVHHRDFEGGSVIMAARIRESGYRTIIRATITAVSLALVGLVTVNAPASQAVSGGVSGAPEAPWTVRITSPTGLCSGTLVDATHVLTARHCTVKGGTFQLRVGSSTFSTDQVRNAPTSVGDVAVITLLSPSSVTPVRLAPSQSFTDSYTNRGVTFFGWGMTRVNTDRFGKVTGYSAPATTIRKTPDGSYIKTRFCQSFAGSNSNCFLKSRTFAQDKVAVLPGDSGGPWVAWSNGWVLIAVEHGGISEVCSGCRGPEGGASVGNSVVRNWIMSSIQTPPPPPSFDFGVMNTSETPPDGVWFRNSPNSADTDRVTGHGVYAGDVIRVECYAFGEAVGQFANRLWYRAANLTRQIVVLNGSSNRGFLNAHYVNDDRVANEIIPGVPSC
jgi:hypothetical protein